MAVGISECDCYHYWRRDLLSQ